MKISKLKAGLVIIMALILPSAVFADAAANPITGESVSVSSETPRNASVGGKEEVIYANLSADGSVSGVHAVNILDVTGAGLLEDFGNYTAVTNLTNTSPIETDGDKISAAAEPGAFYYQGDMSDADLPWLFSVNYALDKNPVEARDLAGRDGSLIIDIFVRKNSSAGAVFYDNYMLQVSLTLDSENCANIVCDGAAIANSGKSKVINYTVMPGNDAQIRITSEVTDFEFDGLQITALPFSMPVEIPDTDGITEQFTPLTDAARALNDGAYALSEGFSGFQSGLVSLSDGSSAFLNGLYSLGDGGAKVVQGSAQIKSALENITASLNAGGPSQPDLGGLARLGDALTALSSSLDGLSALNAHLGEALSGLDGVISGITLSPEEIGSINDESVRNKVAAFYGGVRQVYYGPDGNSGLRALSLALSETLNRLAAPEFSQSLASAAGALGEIAGGASADGMAQLTAGLTKLAGEYGGFHDGLKKYADGVNAAASGYAELNGGLAAFRGGAAEIADGINGLGAGTEKLSGAAGEIPDALESEIDGLLDEYYPADFEPVSFTSSKNTGVSLVQFIITSEGIKTENEAPADAETSEKGFWDRFLSLFS